MITVAPSRSGASYAETPDIRIHSSYDPLKEARKFVDTSIVTTPSTVLLLGPGLNYLEKVIKSRYPETKILSVYYDVFFFNSTGGMVASCWYPKADEPLAAFLRRNIDDFSFDSLTVLEWPPSATAFPEISRFVNNEIAQFAREVNGSILTTAAFGKKWFSNAFKNYVHPENFYDFIAGDKPVVIAASGPSLPLSFPMMKKYRDFFSLWALPSSLSSLLSKEILPDIIISTDAGFYTSYHFYPCKQYPEIPIAMPLTSFPVLNLLSNPIVPFTQSTKVENLLLQNTGSIVTSVSPHGTVAGSALDLALGSGADTIIFSGFDCCYNDLLEHVKPHSFDLPLTRCSSRITPEYSILYERARKQTSTYDVCRGIRTSHALETYAGWFNRRVFSSAASLYRFNPSHVDIRNLTPLDERGFAKLITFSSGGETLKQDTVRMGKLPDRRFRRKHALSLLSRFTDTAKTVKGQLGKNKSTAGFFGNTELLSILSLLFMAESREVVKLHRETGDNNKKAIQKALDILHSGTVFFQSLSDKLKKL